MKEINSINGYKFDKLSIPIIKNRIKACGGYHVINVNKAYPFLICLIHSYTPGTGIRKRMFYIKTQKEFTAFTRPTTLVNKTNTLVSKIWFIYPNIAYEI